MARTCKRVSYKADFNTVKNYVERFLASENFILKDLKGEQVWKKGTGLMTAMQFIKIEYSENEVITYAWIQVGLGGMGGKEMDLTGVVGALPKKKLLTRVEKIESIVRSL